MNLIYVGDCGPKPSGAPISSDQLIRKLAGRGHRIRALTPELTGGDRDLALFDAARPEVEAHHYPVPVYFVDPYERPPARWEEMTRAGVAGGLERLIATARPEALLVRELWLPYATDTARRHRVPVLALVRGNPTSAILAGTFPEDLVEGFLAQLRRSDRIVTVARHLAAGLQGLGLARVSCIENAVDTGRFSPAPRDRALASRLGVAETDVVALHAAQIKPIKRPLDIVRSAAEALPRRPELVFVVVGEGQSVGEMQALVRELGVGGRFRFVPFVDNDAMPGYLSVADLVLVPSEREGMSRVYLEAQACGKTLVASDIAGVREVVVDGVTGLLHRKGDPAHLADRAVVAASHPELRAAIGRAARAQIVARHDIEAAVDRYEALLEEVGRAAGSAGSGASRGDGDGGPPGSAADRLPSGRTG